LASAVRYTTVELSELEKKISSAAEKALALEVKLFEDLVGEVAGRAEAIGLAARALAEIDVAAALAEVAVEGRWCRPRVDDSARFQVTGGRHPVVEAALIEGGEGAFVANECRLSGGDGEGGEDGGAGFLWLLTGPNMAGKSTFLRQNALIAVMAQIGAYVPARSAPIGTIDRLFSRVGAADDLARGRSTFMVEMVETARILNNATEESLVTLDEIGRGTSTYDGLAIAWAVTEHIAGRIGCRALFATHYHELTSLADEHDNIRNLHVSVREWGEKIIFLYRILPGRTNRSYGIHVARLAGLPADVLSEARSILQTLEAHADLAPAADSD